MTMPSLHAASIVVEPAHKLAVPPPSPTTLPNGVDNPYAGSSYTPRLESPGKPLETVYVPLGEGISDELREIGKRRGFVVDDSSDQSKALSKSFRWIEDASILFRNQKGTGLSLLTSTVTGADFERARSAAEDAYGIRGYKMTGALGSIGLSFLYEPTYSAELARDAKAAGWDVKKTPLAIDGGNMLMTSNKDGDPVALVGKNSVLVNWQILKGQGQIDQKEVQKIIGQCQYDGALAIEFRVASVRGKGDTEPQSGGSSAGAGKSGQNNFGLSEKESIQMAAEFEYTRRQIAITLNLPANRVLSIEQAGFHIDMETRPIGKGRVMVSDLNESIVALDAAIAAEKKNPSVIAGAKNGILENLTELRTITNESISQGNQALLDRKAKTLADAGFEVVRAPTNYGGIGRQSSGDLDDINFANGIAATDKDGKTYFITNRSTIGSVLERNFEKRMESLGIEVEWAPTGSKLGAQGGLDCLTKEAMVLLRNDLSSNA